MKQEKKREHSVDFEAAISQLIDGLFITKKFVACMEQKEQWIWIVHDELIGRMWQNNALFYLRLWNDNETHIDPFWKDTNERYVVVMLSHSPYIV